MDRQDYLAPFVRYGGGTIPDGSGTSRHTSQSDLDEAAENEHFLALTFCTQV